MLCISAQSAHVQHTSRIWPDAYSPFKLDRRETKFLIFLLPPATSSNTAGLNGGNCCVWQLCRAVFPAECPTAQNALSFIINGWINAQSLKHSIVARTEVIVSPAPIIKTVCGPAAHFTLISPYEALNRVAPFGTCRLQWAIYITLCIESEGVWVYDMVNCSHLSCLEKGRFSSIGLLPAAQPCACWEDLIGGYFCILEFRGSGPHSNSTHTCSPLVQLGRELHAIIKASLSSEANQT